MKFECIPALESMEMERNERRIPTTTASLTTNTTATTHSHRRIGHWGVSNERTTTTIFSHPESKIRILHSTSDNDTGPDDTIPCYQKTASKTACIAPQRRSILQSIRQLLGFEIKRIDPCQPLGRFGALGAVGPLEAIDPLPHNGIETVQGIDTLSRPPRGILPLTFADVAP